MQTLEKMNTQVENFIRCTADIPMELNAVCTKQVEWLVLQVIAQGELLVDNNGLEHKDCESD